MQNMDAELANITTAAATRTYRLDPCHSPNHKSSNKELNEDDTLVGKIIIKLTELTDKVEHAKLPQNRTLRAKGLYEYTADEVAVFKTGNPQNIKKIKQTWDGGDGLFDFTNDPDYLQLHGTRDARHTWRTKHDAGLGDGDVAHEMHKRICKKVEENNAYLARQQKEAERDHQRQCNGHAPVVKTGRQVAAELDEWLRINQPVQQVYPEPSYKECSEDPGISRKRLREDYDIGLFNFERKPVA